MERTKTTGAFKYLFTFIVMVLLQVLICNNILLFGVAVPFVFIFFILSLPLNVGLKSLMSLSFLLGFLVDIFSDTPGLDSLCCLLLSVVRKPVFYAYMPNEEKFLKATPCISVMGWFNYIKYALTLSAFFCILIFGIELFSFIPIGRIIVMAASSTLFTLLCIIACDALLNKGEAQI